MMASLSHRVKKLEGPYRHGSECIYGPTVILREGQPVPADAPACPYCGDVHALVVIEREVVAPDVAGQQHFQGDGAVEAQVPGLVDDADPAAAQLPLHLVAGQVR
jgi:hypothetical protein